MSRCSLLCKCSCGVSWLCSRQGENWGGGVDTLAWSTASAPRWIATPCEKWVRVETTVTPARHYYMDLAFLSETPQYKCSITAHDPTPAAISWIGTLQVLLMMMKFVTSTCKFYLVIASLKCVIASAANCKKLLALTSWTELT